MPDELLDLFANVPGIQDFVSPAGTTPPPSSGLTADPAHGGVTDEAVQNFVSQRFGRVGPAPVISGQQVPATPQFLPGQGQHAPPPGGLEDGAGAGGSDQVVPGRVEQPATPLPSQAPPSTGQEGEGGVLPGAPPTPPPDLPAEIEFGESRIPRERLEAWIAFQEQVNTDPELQRLLTEYVMRQSQGGPAGLGAIPPPPPTQQPYPGYPPIQPQPSPLPQPQPLPDPSGPFTIPQQYAQPGQFQPGQVGQQQQQAALPQLSPDDLADPAIAALYQTVQAQNAQLAAITQQQHAQAQHAQQLAAEQASRANAENAALLSRVTQSFQSQHELTPEHMAQIHDVAARLQVVPSLMRGIDPTTGLPSRPDPMSAIERAFEIAMGQIPELRQRAEQEVIARYTADQQRKQKVSSLSGTGGSAPRTTPAPTTEQGRNKALHDEVAQMFNGTWNPPEGN